MKVRSIQIGSPENCSTKLGFTKVCTAKVHSMSYLLPEGPV